MSPTSHSQPNRVDVAVLIDGDNAQPSLLDSLFEEIARFGKTRIRRIYGDWTSPNMACWKPILHEHAIIPVQQYRNTPGKNATDSALIIDAMDILYQHSVRCFCIVSSDSDFTRLALRIRESGIMVVGVGRSTTPTSFVNACDTFLTTEQLTSSKPAAETKPTRELTSAKAAACSLPPTVAAAPVATPKPVAAKAAVKAPAAKPVKQPAPKPPAPKPVVPKPSAAKAVPKQPTPKQPAAKSKTPAPVKPKAPATPVTPAKPPLPIEMLRKAFDAAPQDNGWVSLGALGNQLRKMHPGFNSRAWGFSQLFKLLEAASEHFKIKQPQKTGSHYIGLVDGG